MTGLALDSPDFAYVRMRALSWTTGDVQLSTTFRPAAGQALAHLLELTAPRPLFASIRGIEWIDEYGLSPVGKLLEKSSYQLIILGGASFPLPLNELERHLACPCRCIRIADQDIWLFTRGEPPPPDVLTEHLAALNHAEKDKVRDLVRDSYVAVAGPLRRLNSTPLLASGHFDARRILSEPSSFVWVSLLLADRLADLESADGPNVHHRAPRRRILAVSLRGAVLASSLAILTGEKLEIVDHLGPVHRILEGYSLTPSSDSCDYVYVADFVVGGAELKAASTYVWSRGSHLRRALALGTLLHPAEYSNEIRLESLVQLRDCRPDAKYEFLAP
jgi:hypothetical protein